jgi:hypothetical protein
MTPSPNTQSKEVEWKEQLGKALKSLGLGMSGSQADFIFEHVESLFSSTRQQVQEEMVRKLESMLDDGRPLGDLIKKEISLLKETK